MADGLMTELAELRAEVARYGAGHGGETIEAPNVGADALELVVARATRLTGRIVAYELRSLSGAALPAASAGSHLELPVRMPNGIVVARCYSIASDPADRTRYEVAVLRRKPAGASFALHRGYRFATTLACAPPRNDFELHLGSHPAVLVAGGIGITPIRAMAAALQRDGRRYELHYVARSPAQMAWREAIAAQHAMRATFYYSRTPADRAFDAAGLVATVPDDAILYVCGPSRLIESVRVAAARRGLRVREERFDDEAGATHAGVELELVRSRRTVDVPPGVPLLDALLAAGIEAPYGCCAGRCGGCVQRIVAGEVEHRDEVLTDVERRAGRVCLCVARPLSRKLALDL